MEIKLEMNLYQRIEAAAHRRIINALMDEIYAKVNTARDKLLSASPHLDLQFVLDNPTIRWSWPAMSPTVIMNWSDVLDHLDKPWSWPALSRNPSIRMPLVLATMDRPWDWDSLSRNPGIFVSDVLEHPGFHWNWQRVSQNINVTMAVVLAHPEIPWDYDSLCENETITMRHVRAYPNLLMRPWALSRNVNINIRFIRAQKHVTGWNWAALSANPGITMDDVKSHLYYPWTFCHMSANPNLTFDYVSRHILGAWDWSMVSQTVHATPNQVKAIQPMYASYSIHTRPSKCISWTGYSSNGNLALSNVIARPDLPWHYGLILENRLDADYWRVFTHYAHKHLCAVKIQRLWRIVSADPNHAIGRRVQCGRFIMHH